MTEYYEMRGLNPALKMRALIKFLKERLKDDEALLAVKRYTGDGGVKVKGGDDFLELNQNGIAVCKLKNDTYTPIAFYATSANAADKNEDTEYEIFVYNNGFEDGLDKDIDTVLINDDGDVTGGFKQEVVESSWKPITC